MKRILVAIITGIVLFVAAHYLFISEEARFKDVTWKVKRFLQEKSYQLEPVSENTVTLYLKNGSAISGELVSETENKYVINWRGGEVTFYVGEVERVEKGRAAEAEKELRFPEQVPEKWPHENDVVVRLTNGTILDARITGVGKERVTVGYPVEEGGSIEQDINRAKIEYLLFRPVNNQESARTEKSLKELFPEMKFHEEGNFTLVTDSYPTWVTEYKNNLRRVYTEIYLKFFPLFQEREPGFQNFVVVFDDYIDFIEYAAADNVAWWAVLGYFDPEDKVLYLFNMLGDRFAELLFETTVGEGGRFIDRFADQVKKRVGSRREVFIEGQADEIKDKFWRYYNIAKGEMRRETMGVLRHEFAHEVFHNWGLQAIIVSKMKTDKDKLLRRKKDFLQTEDYERKRQLLIELMTMQSREKIPEMQAANSWMGEGTATYCETDPSGGRNEKWLYLFQKMKRENAVYPLEHLTVYKIGSFPGVCPEAGLYAYAQSWAFFTFLMDRYPERFLAYQNKMAEEKAEKQEDIQWLLQALGKDLKTLEKEFLAYMDKYEKVEDPFVKRLEQVMAIFE